MKASNLKIRYKYLICGKYRPSSIDSNPGEFLQFSGVKVVYDMEKESFSRVSDLKVRTRNETTGELVYTDLEDEKEYCFVSSDFLAVKGGDGYDLLRNGSTNCLSRQTLKVLWKSLKKRPCNSAHKKTPWHRY